MECGMCKKGVLEIKKVEENCRGLDGTHDNIFVSTKCNICGTVSSYIYKTKEEVKRFWPNALD